MTPTLVAMPKPGDKPLALADRGQVIRSMSDGWVADRIVAAPDAKSAAGIARCWIAYGAIANENMTVQATGDGIYANVGDRVGRVTWGEVARFWREECRQRVLF